MTREEIEKEYKARVTFTNGTLEELNRSIIINRELLEKYEQWKEQELKKLEVKVYEPHYLKSPIWIESLEEIQCRERHNAMEEFKHELSKLNNGWFPDWYTKKGCFQTVQSKGYLYYSYQFGEVDSFITDTIQTQDDYEYFNPALAEQVKKELGGLWMATEI